MRTPFLWADASATKGIMGKQVYEEIQKNLMWKCVWASVRMAYG